MAGSFGSEHDAEFLFACGQRVQKTDFNGAGSAAERGERMTYAMHVFGKLVRKMLEKL